jgi:hypothetical protein
MKMIVGPLPHAVYWRRRAAVLGIVLVVLLGFSACVNLAFDSGAQRSGPGGGPAGERVSPSASATPSGSASSGSASAGSQSDQGGQTGTQSGSTAGTPPAAPSPSAVPASTASPAPPCADGDMAVLPAAEHPAYQVGDQPHLFLTLKNVSAKSCARDLGADQQEFRIMSGATRVWSSDDCAPVRGKDIRVLVPHQSLTFRLTWPGTTSNPGCTATRQPVAAGTYQMVGRLGSLLSSPVPLVLR